MSATHAASITHGEPSTISEDARRLRHDIRTQLNAIAGYSELLLEGASELATQHKDDLVTVRDAGKSLLQVVDELLLSPMQGEARAEMARLLRHRLITQLTVVIDTAWLLMRETLIFEQPQWQADVERIHVAGSQILGLIDSFERGDGPSLPNHRAAPTATRAPERCDIHALTKGSVLIVDDTASNRDLLSRQLELLGCSVSVAADGVEALKTLSAADFDLLLVDLYMPGLSGEELLTRIRRVPSYRTLPVIMTSALEDFETVVRCLQRGADDFLPKPIDPTLLRARVSSAIERKRMQAREAQNAVLLRQEKQQVEQLLRAILPARAVRELQASERVRPKRYQHVAVLFADVCGFTEFSDRHEPEEVVEYLHELCEAFESICERHGVEKIKTIGDAFMAVAGLEGDGEEPTIRAIECAQEMIRVAPTLSAGWCVRAAVHAGPVVAGVVGRAKFAYDVWGDTVNVAARIESRALPEEVWVSEPTLPYVAERFITVPCGVFELKGKGSTRLFKIDGDCA